MDTELICMACQSGACEKCVDVMHVVLNQKLVCKCERPEHSGEPRGHQILDPETGTVHAPGLTVNVDGDVIYKSHQPEIFKEEK